MLGAIIGDMIGSPYEFDYHAIKTTDFPLFCERSHWTDDTVMTVAVAEALLTRPESAEDGVIIVGEALRRWGRRFPGAGYGARFSGWLASDDAEPYGSFGNGSAMRVSSAGWLYGSLGETEHWAAVTALPTHDHPEGVKGAQSIAAAIYLARTGAPKGEIRTYVEEAYGYNLDRTCDDIRPTYHHTESCQETVPEAIIAFLDSSDFESAVRLAVSLGGDADTLAAITGSIAEAAYGIPNDIKSQAMPRLDPSFLPVLQRFREALPSAG